MSSSHHKSTDRIPDTGLADRADREVGRPGTAEGALQDGEKVSALVFNVQRFSLHDGPGIRTTVFVKGCNLHCFWCHNPESISPQQEIQFFPEKCIGCGNCFEVCPVHAHQLVPSDSDSNGAEDHQFRRDLCTKCGKCVDECYAQALVEAAKPRTVDDVLSIVEADRPYYEESGGGVTVSGGEPLLSPAFLTALLRGCRARGIHTAIDSAVNVGWDRIETVLPDVDLFLIDLKHIDSDAHRDATGVPNERILENIRRLSHSQVPVWIRVPLIPGVNDSHDVAERMAGFLADCGRIERLDVLPFHRLAGAKYESLGKTYRAADTQTPLPEDVEAIRAIFRSAGLSVSE